MKKLKNLGTVLSKADQKKINGGFFGSTGEEDEPLCPTPNALMCNDPNNIAGPNHVCCRGMCVLPTHLACEGIFF